MTVDSWQLTTELNLGHFSAIFGYFGDFSAFQALQNMFMKVQILKWLQANHKLELGALLTDDEPDPDTLQYFKEMGFEPLRSKVVCSSAGQ